MNNVSNYLSHTIGCESDLSFFGKVVAFPFVLFFGTLLFFVALIVAAMESNADN